MKERTHGKTNQQVQFAGRDYEVIRGNWPSGSAALLLVNSITGRALPASLDVGRTPRTPQEIFVPDHDGMVETLEQAGIVRRTNETSRWLSLQVRVCELIHPELIRCSTQTPQVGYVRQSGQSVEYERKDQGRDR